MIKPVKDVFILLFLGTFISGCSFAPRVLPTIYKDMGERTDVIYKPDPLDITVDVKPRVFKSDILATHLEVTVEELRERQYLKYNKIKKRVVTQHLTSNPFCIIFGHPSTSSLCVEKQDEEVSYSRQNEYKSEPEQVWEKSSNVAGMLKLYRVRLEAWDVHGDKVIPLTPVSVEPSQYFNGTFLVYLKSLLELPSEPKRALLIIERLGESGNVVARKEWQMDEAFIASLNLYSDHWLTLEEKKRRYMGLLKDALIKGDDYAAMKYFDAIMALGIELPPVFYYQFAKTLMRLGVENRAVEMYQTYLKLAGPNGQYSKEVSDSLKKMGY